MLLNKNKSPKKVTLGSLPTDTLSCVRLAKREHAHIYNERFGHWGGYTFSDDNIIIVKITQAPYTEDSRTLFYRSKGTGYITQFPYCYSLFLSCINLKPSSVKNLSTSSILSVSDAIRVAKPPVAITLTSS